MTQLTPNPKISIWQSKSFVAIFIASIFVSFGGKVYELALPLIIYDISQSAAAMSNMRAAEFLPNLCLAFCIGVIVDHVNRRLWAQGMLVIQVLLLAGLFLALHFEDLSLVAFYCIGFSLRACNYGYQCAKMGLINENIAKHLLTSATAKITSLNATFDVLGPAVTGLILLLGTLKFGVLLPAVLYFLASVSLFLLPTQLHQPVPLDNFWGSLKEGWQVLRANRPLWEITLFVIALNCTVSVVEILFLFHLRANYDLSLADLGWMFSIIGVGAILGSFIVERVRRAIGLGRVILWTIATEALAYLGLAASADIAILLALMFIVSLASVMQNVCVWSFRQESTATAYIGRVSGITGSLFKLGMPIALIAAGVAGDSFGVGQVFIVCGFVNLLLVILFFRTEAVKQG